MTADAPDAVLVIEPDRLRDLLAAFPLFTSGTRARGKDYAEDGRVLEYESDNGRIKVPSIFHDVVTVTKANVDSTVIADGFHSREEVYGKAP